MAKNKKKTSKSKNKLSFAERMLLRLSLLKFWFIKNLSTFFWSLFIICVGLTFSGVIKDTTPVLGAIFGDLSNAIRDVTKNGYPIYAIIESLISLGIIIAVCATKFKRLALVDIKSTRCKILLVKAGLYFNEKGKLTKRIEKITKMDLNGDGKIDEKDAADVVRDESIVQGLKRAGEEFVTIVTLDLKNVEKTDKDEIYKTTGLAETKSGVDELIQEVAPSTKKLLNVASNSIDAAAANKKIKLMTRLMNKIKMFFSDLKIAFSITTKDEDAAYVDKVHREQAKQIKLEKKKKKEAEKKAKKAEKERIKQEKKLSKQRKEEAAKAEKAKMKQVQPKPKKEEPKPEPKVNKQKVKTEEQPAQPASNYSSVQAQLSALLKNRK